MMERLETPYIDNDLDENDEKYTAEKIINVFFHRNSIIPAAESEAEEKKLSNNEMSAIQRSVYANWPNTTMISKMKNRSVDVTRKVIILLYLATYDCDEEMMIPILKDR